MFDFTMFDGVAVNAATPYIMYVQIDDQVESGITVNLRDQPGEFPEVESVSFNAQAIPFQVRRGTGASSDHDTWRAAVMALFNPRVGVTRELRIAIGGVTYSNQVFIPEFDIQPGQNEVYAGTILIPDPFWTTVTLVGPDSSSPLTNAGTTIARPVITFTPSGTTAKRIRISVTDVTGRGLVGEPIHINSIDLSGFGANYKENNALYFTGRLIPFVVQRPGTSTAELDFRIDCAANGTVDLDLYYGSSINNTITAGVINTANLAAAANPHFTSATPVWTAVNGGVFSIVADSRLYGGNVGKIVAPGSVAFEGGESDKIPAAVSTQYTFSIGTISDAGETIAMDILEYLGAVLVRASAPSTIVGTGAKQVFTKTHTTGTGIDQVAVRIYTAVAIAPQTILLDGLRMEAGATATDNSDQPGPFVRGGLKLDDSLHTSTTAVWDTNKLFDTTINPDVAMAWHIAKLGKAIAGTSVGFILAPGGVKVADELYLAVAPNDTFANDADCIIVTLGAQASASNALKGILATLSTAAGSPRRFIRYREAGSAVWLNAIESGAGTGQWDLDGAVQIAIGIEGTTALDSGSLLIEQGGTSTPWRIDLVNTPQVTVAAPVTAHVLTGALTNTTTGDAITFDSLLVDDGPVVIDTLHKAIDVTGPRAGDIRFSNPATWFPLNPGANDFVNPGGATASFEWAERSAA